MPLSDRSDKNLIQAYLDGDSSSFDSLYERYRRPLYAYLNKMLPGQSATVDDLFQKTWIKAINSLHRYQDRQTFHAWLVRIAHNAAVDHFRSEGKHQAVDISELRIASENAVEPWSRLAEKEFNAALEQAISELPPDQREVLLLRRGGVPFKEIAATQKSSINTVLGRMHYAINKLRQLLREEAT